ncbi:putative ankyrin repeat domain-containing protein 26-like protein [Sarcophilus harrisii]
MKKIFNFGRKKGQSPPRPFIKLPSYFGVQTPYPTEGYQIRSKDLGKIHKAALLGDVAKVQQLLLLGKSTVNDLDKMKRTPLHLACANGYPDVVSLLVERKCELNLLDNDSRTPLIKEGFTPLLLAITTMNTEMADFLLKNGANVNALDSCKRYSNYLIF